MTQPGESLVRESQAEDVKQGETIWAPEDGDWLKVARIAGDGYGEITFYRTDGTLADFREGQTVLVLVQ